MRHSQQDRAQRDQDQPEPSPQPKQRRRGEDDLAVQARLTGEAIQLLEQIRARLGHDETQKADVIPVVPQEGSQLVPAGADFDYELSGLPAVGTLVFDVPENVDATVTKNGNAFVGIQDGQGRSGTLELPGSTLASWNSVGIEGTNNAGNAQDVGLWVAVVYDRG